MRGSGLWPLRRGNTSLLPWASLFRGEAAIVLPCKSWRPTADVMRRLIPIPPGRAHHRNRTERTAGSRVRALRFGLCSALLCSALRPYHTVPRRGTRHIISSSHSLSDEHSWAPLMPSLPHFQLGLLLPPGPHTRASSQDQTHCAANLVNQARASATLLAQYRTGQNRGLGTEATAATVQSPNRKSPLRPPHPIAGPVMAAQAPARASSSTVRLFDAHCHLQDPRVAAIAPALIRAAAASGVARFAVNGTSEVRPPLPLEPPRLRGHERRWLPADSTPNSRARRRTGTL